MHIAHQSRMLHNVPQHACGTGGPFFAIDMYVVPMRAQVVYSLMLARVVYSLLHARVVYLSAGAS